MKKTTRRVIVVAASFILLLIILLLITASKYIYAIIQMEPAETRALNDSVYCIRNKYVNAWVFEVYRGYIIIDAGISKKKMKDELSKLEINPDDILAVVLTHSDPDHSGGLNAFENGAYKPFFDIINMDTETQVKSLKKLPSPDNFKYILTSHTGFSNTDQ